MAMELGRARRNLQNLFHYIGTKMICNVFLTTVPQVLNKKSNIFFFVLKYVAERINVFILKAIVMAGILHIQYIHKPY